MMPMRARRQAAPPTAKPWRLPAPIGGLNNISPGADLPPTDCYALYNMIPAERGLRVRLGSQQWAGNVGQALTTAGTPILSVLPFTGSQATKNKLFVTVSTGIWEVTESGFVDPGNTWFSATHYVAGELVTNSGGLVYEVFTGGTTGVVEPSGTGQNIATADGLVWNYVGTPNANVAEVFSFASSANNAGRGVCHVHVTSAGHFLLYWDEENGLHIYTESTDTWAAPTMGAGAAQISGVDPADLVFGTVFKGRVWHVERDSARLWYQNTGAVYGTATEFNQSTKLRAGGSIRGIWNNTGDGGSGMDDTLVYASDGGDIVIWQGTDPTDAALFGMVGVWQVGALPKGRDIATDVGGDLQILTRLGIISLSKLQVGRNVAADQYETAKVSHLFNALMQSRAESWGWSMRLHPEDNSLVVTVPDPGGTGLIQLVMSMSNKSWSVYRDLDMSCAASFDGKLYYGSPDGSVWINTGNVDDVELGDSSGTAIQYAGLSAFQSFGTPTQKQVTLIRPRFIGQSGAPSFSVQARFDFDETELATVVFSGGSTGGWGSGLWGTAVWGGDYAPSSAVRGASGLGVNAAIIWRGASVDRTVLVAFEGMMLEGGFL